MLNPYPLTIGAALVTSWLSGNGWRRSDSQVEDMFSLAPYLTMANLAEKAHLDFLFRPDTLFLAQHALATEPGFSGLEPFTLLSALATHTHSIGLVCTASTTFLPPYQIARQLQSLHWLSQGRAGWNVVTALDGQQNFGLQDMPSQSRRYDKAEQCLEAVQALWQSYPNEALKMDKTSGQFAQCEAINAVDYHNDLIQTAGPLTTPMPPYGCPPLFQAGASPTGREFAAKFANVVFAATPDIEAGIELRTDLRNRAVAQGRPKDSIKVLPGLSLYLHTTREGAQALYQSTHANTPVSRRYDYIEEAIGVDLRKTDPGQRIHIDELPPLERAVRSHTHSNLIRRYIERESPTVAQLLQRPEVVGSSHWLVIGTPEDAVEQIIERVQAGAADGFIAVFGGSQASMRLFFDDVMPSLAKQGWFRDHYQHHTLAEHLQG